MKRLFLFLVLAGFLGTGLSFADDAGFVASKGGGKYHVPTCPVAKQIKADNKINFKTPEEAVKAGYTACKVCNPATTTVAQSAAFVGSKDSNKYHKPDCRLVKNIKAENKVGFASIEDAEKANYKSCAICFPPEKAKAKADQKK